MVLHALSARRGLVRICKELETGQVVVVNHPSVGIGQICLLDVADDCLVYQVLPMSTKDVVCLLFVQHDQSEQVDKRDL